MTEKTREQAWDEFYEFMGTMIRRCLVPNSKDIVRIWKKGNIPVVFDSNTDREERLGMLAIFGVHKDTSVVSVSRTKLRKTLGIAEQPAERKWLAVIPNQTRNMHVLVYTGTGSLMMIHTPTGWEIAKGTTDKDLLN